MFSLDVSADTDIDAVTDNYIEDESVADADTVIDIDEESITDADTDIDIDDEAVTDEVTDIDDESVTDADTDLDIDIVTDADTEIETSTEINVDTIDDADIGTEIVADLATDTVSEDANNAPVKTFDYNYNDLEPILVTADEGVEINEWNFPDYEFRLYIEEYFDLDHNGYLDKEEINNVLCIRLGYYVDDAKSAATGGGRTDYASRNVYNSVNSTFSEVANRYEIEKY